MVDEVLDIIKVRTQLRLIGIETLLIRHGKSRATFSRKRRLINFTLWSHSGVVSDKIINCRDACPYNKNAAKP